MSDVNNTPYDEASDKADSKADAIAAFCLIMIAVAGMIYLVS